MQCVDEVYARLKSVDIHENALGTEMGRKAVIDAPSVSTAVLPSVANEDSRHLNRQTYGKIRIAILAQKPSRVWWWVVFRSFVRMEVRKLGP